MNDDIVSAGCSVRVVGPNHDLRGRPPYRVAGLPDEDHAAVAQLGNIREELTVRKVLVYKKFGPNGSSCRIKPLRPNAFLGRVCAI